MASQGDEEEYSPELATCSDRGPASIYPAHSILTPDGPFQEIWDASGYQIFQSLGNSEFPPEQILESGEEGGDEDIAKEGAAEEDPAPCTPNPDADCPQGEDENNIRAFPFTIRLWAVVEDSSFESIYWSRDGESIIIEGNLFKTEVLGHRDNHRIFGTESLKTFVRLLNLHGFRKLHYKSAILSSARNRVMAYRNHNFQREQPELLNNIRRKGRERPPAAQTSKRRSMEPTRRSRRLHPGSAIAEWAPSDLLGKRKICSREEGACGAEARASDLLLASSEEAGPHGPSTIPSSILVPSAEENLALISEVEVALSNAMLLPGVNTEVHEVEGVSRSVAFPSAMQNVLFTEHCGLHGEGMPSSSAFASAGQNVCFPEDSRLLDEESVGNIFSIALRDLHSMEVDGLGESKPSAIEFFNMTEEGRPHVPDNILFPSAVGNANPMAEAWASGTFSSALCSVIPMEEGGPAVAVPGNTLAAPATAGPQLPVEACTDLQVYNTHYAILLMSQLAMGPNENPPEEKKPETH